MAKYTNWEDFIKSGSALLQQIPKNFYLEKGAMVFTITLNGADYYCSGRECEVSDMYFDPTKELKYQCDFDNFLMFEKGNASNQICNWN